MKPCELAVQIFPTNTWTFTKATVRHGTAAVRSCMCEIAQHVTAGMRLEHSRIQPCIHSALNKQTAFRKGKDPCAYLLIAL